MMDAKGLRIFRGKIKKKGGKKNKDDMKMLDILGIWGIGIEKGPG